MPSAYKVSLRTHNTLYMLCVCVGGGGLIGTDGGSMRIWVCAPCTHGDVASQAFKMGQKVWLLAACPSFPVIETSFPVIEIVSCQ